MRRRGRATANCCRNWGKAVDWNLYLLVCLCVSMKQNSNWSLFIYLFIYFSQGQRGRFRNGLNRTGQHGLAHFRDPRTNWVIDWYFALGGTNGPGPVGSYRHCLVQQTAAAVPWLQNIFFQPEIHSSFLLSQISKALLFVWDTTFEYCAQTLFFKGWSLLKLHRIVKCDVVEHVSSVLSLLVLLAGAEQFPCLYLTHRT